MSANRQFCDVVVIGGGILGCFAARNLMRWDLSVVLIEAAEDVCTGITRANTAIVYPGYDHKPGSLKAKLTVEGNASFDELCKELDVPFWRCGSLLVSYGPRADRVLQKKYEHGLANEVPGLVLLSGEEANRREPMLAPGVSSALYAPSTGTVNPWQLGIAAYENAVENGCRPELDTRVIDIRKTEEGYLVETDRDVFACKAVINCAGANADRVQEMLFDPSVRLRLDGADFMILDKHAKRPEHVIFHEPEEKRKSITAVPTVDGNLLLGPSQRGLDAVSFATKQEGLDFLRQTTAEVMPEVDASMVIRSFGSVRPNPYRMRCENGEWVPDSEKIHDFMIENPGTGFYSLIGVKTPGLTCANELGKYLATRVAQVLGAGANVGYQPVRKGIVQMRDLSFEERVHYTKRNPEYGEILCQCEDVTKAEIREAIRRGAKSVAGVKRRVGSGMGRCQGSRCTHAIETLLGEML